MERKPLSGSRFRSAAYDASAQRLELEFSDRSMRVFKGVPAEVWRRLQAAPNAGSYFDDRIADEYPSQPGSAAPSTDAQSRLNDLFGAPPSDSRGSTES